LDAKKPKKLVDYEPIILSEENRRALGFFNTKEVAEINEAYSKVHFPDIFEPSYLEEARRTKMGEMTKSALVFCRNCRQNFNTDKYLQEREDFSEPVKCPHCHCFLDALAERILWYGYSIVVTQMHSVVGKILYCAVLPSEGELEQDRSHQRLFWHECISICKYSTEVGDRYGCNTFLNPKDAVAYVEKYIAEVDYDESNRVKILLADFTKDMGASAVERFEKGLEEYNKRLGGRWAINIVPHSELTDDGENCCAMCKPRV
jgi:hypothetical protein